MRRPRPYILALLAAVLLTLPFAIGAGDAVLDAKRSAAAKLLKDGKAADAQKLYEEIIAQDDSAWSDHYALAKIYDKSGETGKAIERFGSVVSLLRNRTRAPAERAALAEVEKRLKALDSLSGELDTLLAEFSSKLRNLGREARRTGNQKALARITDLYRSVLLAGGGETTTVTVNAFDAWTNTGIRLGSGTGILVVASGEWNLDAKREDTKCGAKGAKTGAYRGMPSGALVAKIGDSGKLIQVGAEAEIIPDSDGILFLGCNDSNTADNAGALTVRIVSLP